jgi:hypothetical protein
MKRTTYSRKNMTIAPDENGDGKKRRKTDSPPDDERPRSARGDMPRPSTRPRSKSHAKKFSRPFDDKDEDIKDELAPLLCDSPDWKTKKKPSAPHNVLDKWSVKDLPSFKKAEPTIHSGQSDYQKLMASKQKANKQKKKFELERLKATLAEKERKRNDGSQTSKDYSRLKGGLLHRQHIGGSAVDGHAAGKAGGSAVRKPSTNLPTSFDHEDSEISKMFARVIKAPSVKVRPFKTPYVHKQYMATPTSAPFKDICQRRIRDDSKEAKLWSQNQSTSPLLRLPGELRNRIYELVLGGKTICVEFKTWHNLERNGHTALDCQFKYHYKVMNAKTNPWAPYISTAIQQSEGLSRNFTLLNGVCRQLYQETAVLPYKLNRWAFANHLTMWNFLVVERRWTRAQRESIEELVVSDHLPQANLLELLTGLKKALLASPLTAENRAIKGWHSVEKSEQGRKLVKDQTSTLSRR